MIAASNAVQLMATQSHSGHDHGCSTHACHAQHFLDAACSAHVIELPQTKNDHGAKHVADMPCSWGATGSADESIRWIAQSASNMTSVA